MKVVFWVDSRIERGGGHLSRSLTLAHTLITIGHDVSFILEESSSFLDLANIRKFLAANYDECFNQIRLINDDSEIDWLVIDNYDISDLEENRVRPYTKYVLVIDDLGNRAHNCDILVDQNIQTGVQDRYVTLVPEGCKVLTGLRYLLAKPQFYEEYDVCRSGTLIFLGSSNYTDDLLLLLKVLKLVQPSELFKVLITSAYGLTNLAGIKADSNFEVYRDLTDPSALFRSAKRAIVRCGFASYELALSGVPTLNIFSTEIQREVGRQLEAIGYGTTICEDQILQERTLLNRLRVLEKLHPPPLSRLLSPGCFEIAKEMELLCE